ncbi:MAG TPA: Ig-like domain-containing protein, partial [Bryobacteraceae bacterium]|nr:Ig-like domain-containing protein [Bryobacteraceae bacterium]
MLLLACQPVEGQSDSASGAPLGLSPSKLEFSDYAVNTASLVQTATLTNTSSGVITNIAVTINGDFSQTNTCGSNLAPGANCTISVTFSPTGTGLRTGVVTITSGGGTLVALNLSGIGYALVSIAIFPQNRSIAPGTNKQFIAIGTYSDGSTLDITSSAAWKSSSTSAVTMNSSGLATGIGPGGTTISASLHSITSSTNLTVTTATLVGIAVGSASLSTPQGIKQQFYALGRFSDSTIQNITTSVTWSSSAMAVATVDNLGVVFSLAAGKSQISAKSGSITGGNSLTVTSVALSSIAVTPNNPTIPTASVQPFKATGSFTDGSQRDLTASVTWSSSAPRVALIGPFGAAAGLAAGNATISAAEGPITASTLLSVKVVRLLSIALNNANPSVAKGVVQPFTATGTFADSTTRDLTAVVHWSSSASSVATINNTQRLAGRATALGVGTSTIASDYGPSIKASTTLTVTAATLVSIVITPANPSVPVGLTQQFTATGRYSDRSTQDLTTQVTWSSSVPTAAMISNDPGSEGLATTAGPGTTSITATLGAISAATKLTVSSPQLVSITVTPANASLSVGGTPQFTATGTNTDSSTQDITAQVTWASSMPGVASISNAAGSQGLAQALAAGNTTISATLGSVSGSTNLNVVSVPILVSLGVTPPTASIGAGQTRQFAVTGTYSNSSTSDLTSTATWSSDTPSVATVSDAAGTKGLATGVAAGRAKITATVGNLSSSGTLTVTGGPTVAIAQPANLSYLNLSPTTVNGTVSDPTATVTINSIPAAVSNGAFSIQLPLAEGPNLITATATSASGLAGTATIQVTLDATPPHVTITSPPDQFVTTDGSTTISGIVNDIVVGTVNAQQAQVKVNGVAAQVANRTFQATNVPLNIGTNIIQAVAVDQAGNSNNTQITVTRQPPSAQAKIQLISGNNQTGVIGSILTAPLIVALTDSAGNPVPNTPVIFKVTQNNGMVATGGTPGSSVVANTNAQGQALAHWTLGMRAGAGSDTVEAYAVSFNGTAIFNASSTLGPAGNIVIDSGNNQIAAINQPLPKPLIAVVVDAGNNRLPNVPVTFTVAQGGGSFAGQPSFTVNTDSDGRVAAIPTLGNQEGNSNNLISATFPGNQGFPASFTASGRAEGPAANTVISGLVLDNSNQPIPGVTVRAVLTNVVNSNLASVQGASAVQTDPKGQFSITPAPVGLVKLLVDGSTATAPGTFPTLEYDVVTVAGQVNTVGQPIYLLPIKTNNQLCVTMTTGGGTLIIPEAPGFSLTFAPGQVTFPGGSKTGCVSVTVVHPDKVPMVPGFGQQPRFIVTIQPSGALFNPPAPITLPNVDGLAPREVTEMYSFDHDIGSFVAIGTGTVSDDGQVIRSNPGVGVLKAGWHCGGNPSSSGIAATCPVCFFCPGSLANCQPQGNGTPCGNGGTCQFGLGCVGGGGCPTGYTLTNGQCCQGGTCVPPSCPQGQILVNGTCVNSGPCAPGYTLTNGQCCT